MNDIEVTICYKGSPATVNEAIHGHVKTINGHVNNVQSLISDLNKKDVLCSDLVGELEVAREDLNTRASTIAKLQSLDQAAQLDLKVARTTVQNLNIKLEHALIRERGDSDKAREYRDEIARLKVALDSANEEREDAFVALDHERDVKTAAQLSLDEEKNFNVKLKIELNNALIREHEQRAARLVLEDAASAFDAVSGGKVTVKDVLDFMSSRKAGFDITKPTKTTDGERKAEVYYDVYYYPFNLLNGSRMEVKIQVLDCFGIDASLSDKAAQTAAIKILQARAGIGLLEAKDLVEWAVGIGEYKYR